MTVAIVEVVIPNRIANKRQRCTSTVAAVISDIVKSVDHEDGGVRFAPAYEYYFGGNVYRKTLKVYSTSRRECRS